MPVEQLSDYLNSAVRFCLSHTHTCVRAHTHTHIHIRARAHTHARTRARTRTHTHTHTHTDAHAHTPRVKHLRHNTYLDSCVCLFVCLFVVSSRLGFVHPLQDVALHQCLPYVCRKLRYTQDLPLQATSPPFSHVQETSTEYKPRVLLEPTSKESRHFLHVRISGFTLKTPGSTTRSNLRVQFGKPCLYCTLTFQGSLWTPFVLLQVNISGLTLETLPLLHIKISGFTLETPGSNAHSNLMVHFRKPFILLHVNISGLTLETLGSTARSNLRVHFGNPGSTARSNLRVHFGNPGSTAR